MLTIIQSGSKAWAMAATNGDVRIFSREQAGEWIEVLLSEESEQLDGDGSLILEALYEQYAGEEQEEEEEPEAEEEDEEPEAEEEEERPRPKRKTKSPRPRRKRRSLRPKRKTRSRRKRKRKRSRVAVAAGPGQKRSDAGRGTPGRDFAQRAAKLRTPKTLSVTRTFADARVIRGCPGGSSGQEGEPTREHPRRRQWPRIGTRARR